MIDEHAGFSSGCWHCSIIQTRWFAVFAFLLLYSAFYRWAYDRKTRAERLEDALQRVRRIEERSHE